MSGNFQKNASQLTLWSLDMQQDNNLKHIANTSKDFLREQIEGLGQVNHPNLNQKENVF